jgi:hypothetical protein
MGTMTSVKELSSPTLIVTELFLFGSAFAKVRLDSLAKLASAAVGMISI